MRKPVIFLISLLVIALDQVSKWWVRANLTDYSVSAIIPKQFSTVDIIPNHFRLFLNFNTGGAFSIFSGNVLILALISLGVSCALISYIWKNQMDGWQSLGWALLLGGAIGNFIDRIAFHRVTDFFDAYAGIHHFPTFNVADIGIDVGVGLLLLVYALTPAKTKGKAGAPTDSIPAPGESPEV